MITGYPYVKNYGKCKIIKFICKHDEHIELFTRSLYVPESVLKRDKEHVNINM